MTGCQIVAGLCFLNDYPQYQCLSDGKWQSCEREFICDQGISRSQWRINYEDEGSFKNWVDPDKLDLTCTDERLIGMMGLVYFFGFGISALIIPRIADKHGRKWPYFWSLMVQLFGYVQIFYSKSIY